MTEYKRDKRSPTPKNHIVSRVMSANKGKNTKPEKELRHELWKNNLRGYRINYKKVPGRPDIAFISKKTAIFVNGCYWHRCPYCNLQLPKHNTSFWKMKFEKNIERDNRKKLELESLGWNVIIIWECLIKTSLQETIEKVRSTLNK